MVVPLMFQEGLSADDVLWLFLASLFRDLGMFWMVGAAREAISIRLCRSWFENMSKNRPSIFQTTESIFT